MCDPLTEILSSERLSPYLEAAGFDTDRALELYAWNLRISASYYPLLASIEVCLRNRITNRLGQRFGARWWESRELIGLLGKRGKGILLRATGDITKREQELTGGRVTAELSFGFWQNMLLQKYQDALWEDMQAAFPDIPPRTQREELYDLCEKVRILRNRISHHETIFRRDLSFEYANCMKLSAWMSEAKTQWIRPKLEVMKIMRQRP